MANGKIAHTPSTCWGNNDTVYQAFIMFNSHWYMVNRYGPMGHSVAVLPQNQWPPYCAGGENNPPLTGSVHFTYDCSVLVEESGFGTFNWYKQ